MEEWLSNELVSTFAIPDRSGFVTPTLKNINDNFTYSSYSEWILEASDNALMAEKARILSMLENGVESDEQLIVAMTGVVAIIDRQLNARRYMKVSDKRKLTDQGRKKVLDEQAKRLDKELADQMAKYQKKIEENEKATNDRLEELCDIYSKSDESNQHYFNYLKCSLNKIDSMNKNTKNFIFQQQIFYFSLQNIFIKYHSFIL